MQRFFGRAAAAALTVGLAAPASAQTIDFLTTNGGFTATSITGTNAWTWAAGTGWTVPGSTTVARQRLLSPVLTASGGAFSVSATHRYNFEEFLTNTPPTCFDGGVVLASINGGAFAPIAPTSGKAYDGVISATFSNPLAGANAFCGVQAANVTSVFSGTLAAGSTLRLALDGAWDSSFANASPNWNLRGVTLSGFGAPVSTVPEPSTYALMATGLIGLAVAARRRAAK